MTIAAIRVTIAMEIDMQSPPKLQVGDEIRVLALSRSLGGVMGQGGITQHDVDFAAERLQSIGLTVTFGRHVMECNTHLTASPEHRAEDLHEAIGTPSVKGILSAVGGVGAIQLLDLLDYERIAENPKVLCGYSDVTYLWSAIGRCSGVMTYYGPNFTSFMMRRWFDYSLESFRRCLFGDGSFELEPSDTWSDDAWHESQEDRNLMPNEGYWPVQEGVAEGRVVGGACFCLNMLQGTRYFPLLDDAILFLESPEAGKATLMDLDSALRALSLQPGFHSVRGIVLGRYGQNGLVTRENLTALVREIGELRRVPVIANCDFGHTTPSATLPLGGRCRMKVEKSAVSLVLTEM